MKDVFTEAILNQETLSGFAVDDSKETVNVAFGVDAKYVRGMGISMLSLMKYNPDINFVFHVFYNSITTTDKIKLHDLVRIYNSTLILYQIDSTTFSQLPTIHHFTHAIYNRLLIASQLKGKISKVLYMDSDALCIGNIRELLDVDMGDNIVAAVSDREHIVARQIAKLNLKNNKYFNSGVIYIDIDKWHDNDISTKAFDLIVENYNSFTWPDQDALNIALDGRGLFLNNKWNYLYDIGAEREIPPDDIVILHYVGKVKPWVSWCLNPVKKYFLDLYKESLWKNVPLDLPENHKQFRMLAKTTQRYEGFWKGLFLYRHYVKAKIKYLLSRM